MAKNTKILIIILALLLIALIGVLICKKNENLSGNHPVWNRGKDITSNEVETPNEVFDENIVQIVSGEIIQSEEETATFYYPQLVGNTEDIQHANEEIKQLYTEVYENRIIAPDSNQQTEIGFQNAVFRGMLSFIVEKSVQGEKVYYFYRFKQNDLTNCTNEDFLKMMDTTDEAMTARYNQMIELGALEAYKHEAEKLNKIGIQSFDDYYQKLQENAKIESILDERVHPFFITINGDIYTLVRFTVGDVGQSYEGYQKYLSI